MNQINFSILLKVIIKKSRLKYVVKTIVNWIQTLTQNSGVISPSKSCEYKKINLTSCNHAHILNILTSAPHAGFCTTLLFRDCLQPAQLHSHRFHSCHSFKTHGKYGSAHNGSSEHVIAPTRSMSKLVWPFWS